MKKITRNILIGGAAVVVLGVAGSYAIGSNPIYVGAAFLNLFRSTEQPGKGTITVELRQAATETPVAPGPQPAPGANVEWASYNQTVDSQRFSGLNQINADNAGQLKVLCTYDTGKLEGNENGLLMIGGSLIGTTAEDIYSIDASTCKENWRVHEKSGLPMLPVNRGAAYLDGKVFRGYVDGYIRAYDVTTGKLAWASYVGEKSVTLWFNSAPIAYDGKVFYGTAGGDLRDVRGRVYALDAATGKPLWQTFTVPRQAGDTLYAPEGKMPAEEMKASWGNPPSVPISGGGAWTSLTLDPKSGYLYIPVGNPSPDFVKSLRPGSNLFANTMLVLDSKNGNYVKHYKIMPDDWHDWDMSNPPTLYTSRAGKQVVSFSPKDGHLYSYDRSNDQQMYRQPVTKVENVDAQFEPGKPVHFCPGTVGGGEWNSAAYDPSHNLLFTGENEWCATIKTDKPSTIEDHKLAWGSVAYISPFDSSGKFDSPKDWGGWIYATDADTGQWAWRARTNYPIQAAVTPTAGGIIMFGDMGGNFYVLRSRDGQQLFHHDFDGAMAGGLITYTQDGKQRVAFSQGMAHPIWPVKPTTGKVVVMGL